jgi:aspartyl-tRNA(Asn)/glutamyl-tRNA(Gln) amidotransferase subunit C
MSIDRAEIEHLCMLAHLDLSPREVEAMRDEIEVIVEHVARIQSVDTEGVPGTAFAVPTDTVLREDEPWPSWPQSTVLVNAPHAYDGFFEVPAVFD